jgi:hypothetical protein
MVISWSPIWGARNFGNDLEIGDGETSDLNKFPICLVPKAFASQPEVLRAVFAIVVELPGPRPLSLLDLIVRWGLLLKYACWFC